MTYIISLKNIGYASATHLRLTMSYPGAYLNPNERKVNQQIKSCVCANRFYDHIEEQKNAVSEYLDKRFGRWYDDITYDT